MAPTTPATTPATAPPRTTTTTIPRPTPPTCQVAWGPSVPLAYVVHNNGQRLQNVGSQPIKVDEPVLLVALDGAGRPYTWMPGGANAFPSRVRTTVIQPGQTVDVLYEIGEDECRQVDGRYTSGAMVIRGTVGGTPFQAVVRYTGP